MAELSDAPDPRGWVRHRAHTKWLTQVGWLGQTGAFYSMLAPLREIHANERGGYSPIYTEVCDG